MPPVACPKCSVVVYETASGGWRFDPPTGCVDRIGSNGPNLCCSVLKPSAYGPSTHVPSADLRMSQRPAGLACGVGEGLVLCPIAPSCPRSEEHTSELQSPCNLVCRLLLEKKKNPTPGIRHSLCGGASRSIRSASETASFQIAHH